MRLLTLLVTFLTAVCLLVGIPRLSAATTVRVMPLGDSITGSPGCWRSLLWNKLQSAGTTNADFVGTLPPQGCGVAHDGDNEGHGGALVTSVADQNQLVGWLSAAQPDVVMMHFGTNDVWSNRSPSTILAAYTKLVGQMRDSNPGMKVLVAQIIPMNPSSCPECASRVVALNQAIPGWASANTTAQSPITVVDQWTGFNTATDTGDGVHPNAAGDQKIADRWYPALSAALGTVTTPPTTPTTPPTTPTTPPSSISCTLTIAGQWQGGFQGTLTIHNNGTAPLNGWSAWFNLALSWTIPSGWSGQWSRTGTRVTITSLSWNAALPANGSVTAGFLGWGSGPLPTECFSP